MEILMRKIYDVEDAKLVSLQSAFELDNLIRALVELSCGYGKGSRYFTGKWCQLRL